jgi:hypothetical protein
MKHIDSTFYRELSLHSLPEKNSARELSFTDYFPPMNESRPEGGTSPSTTPSVDPNEHRSCADLLYDFKQNDANLLESPFSYSPGSDGRSYTAVVRKKSSGGSVGDRIERGPGQESEKFLQISKRLQEMIPAFPPPSEILKGKPETTHESESTKPAISLWPLVWALTVLFFLAVIFVLCFTRN